MTKTKKLNLVSWHTNKVNQTLIKKLVSCSTNYDYIEYKLQLYTAEITDKDNDQLKPIENENNSEDISEELDRNDIGVFNGKEKKNGIKRKCWTIMRNHQKHLNMKNQMILWKM